MPVSGPLLFLCALMLSACRQDSPIVTQGDTIRFQLSMGVGDRYRYDRWTLDQFGYPLPNGKTEEAWTVTQAGASVFGETGVTVLTDSGATTLPLTVYMRMTPAGELYQYGFLDMVLRQMGAGKATPSWDLLLPSNPGSGAGWVVGVDDSATTDTVYGSFTVVPEYFSARLNGVSVVFPAYRVDLRSQRIQYSYWVTDAPTCIAAFMEQSTGYGNGYEAFLSRATIFGEGSP